MFGTAAGVPVCFTLGALMFVLAGVVYFLVGIVSVFALIQGIEAWLDVPSFVAVLIAIVVGFFPLIGGIASLIATIDVWGWPWWQAVVVFILLPYGLFGAAALLSRD